MRSPRLKNSTSASMATPAAMAASNAGGPHHTSATTSGIRMAAVKMRRSIRASASHRMCPARRLSIAARRIRPVAAGAEPAVAPLALLEINERLEQPSARKIGPQLFGDVDFCIRNLPEQKIAHPHFPARAYQEIGIGQSGGVKMIG